MTNTKSWKLFKPFLGACEREIVYVKVFAKILFYVVVSLYFCALAAQDGRQSPKNTRMLYRALTGNHKSSRLSFCLSNVSNSFLSLPEE